MISPFENSEAVYTSIMPSIDEIISTFIENEENINHFRGKIKEIVFNYITDKISIIY